MKTIKQLLHDIKRLNNELYRTLTLIQEIRNEVSK